MFTRLSRLTLAATLAGVLLASCEPCFALDVIVRVKNNAPQSFQRGDIVMVKDDAREWGRHDRDPLRFYIFHIPGVSILTAVEWMKNHVDGTAVLAKRRYYVAIDTLPAGVKATLAATGEYTVATLAAIKNYIIDKTTGVPIP